MIAYDQKLINSNGQPSTSRIVGRDSKSCAIRLSKFRFSRNLERSELSHCFLDVAKNGYHYTVKQQEKSIARKENKLSLSKVISGSLALFDIIKGDIASDQEIKARAAICANCPLISDTSDKCTGCSSNKLFSYAKSLAVKYGRNYYQPTITAQHLTPKKTAQISEFYCGHCGCSCLNLVLSKSKHFLEKENQERPANCWVHSL